jgi:alpha amylase-like protein
MRHPLLYEINTRCWLRALSEAHRQPVALAEVPDSEFLYWQRLGFTHVWLMGVWAGGPRARGQALSSPGLRQAYSEALPDWTDDDVGPSPYAVADYHVSATLGGDDALAKFRQKLHSFGLKLVLDFVPNHLGLDHPWVRERPELFVQATKLEPETFDVGSVAGRKYLAYGKDPNWSAWTDTVQIDYRRAEARATMIALLRQVAEQCDGVRCDMAMLLLNEVFRKTWERFPVLEPGSATEFWIDAITATRRVHPDFLFLAEVYWGLERRLQELGFDYTYDKALYDALISREPGSVQRHLLAMGPDYVGANAHFLENHDEPRIASVLSLPEHRAAALVILGLPGMRLVHEGQLSGMRKRLPVQLNRRASEPVDPQIQTMYDQLFGSLRASAVGQGAFDLLAPRQAWENNPTTQHFVLVQWSNAVPNFDLAVVNLAPHASQCYAPVKPPTAPAQAWTVSDMLGTDRFIRNDDDLRNRGLYLDLPAHGGQILHFEPLGSS